MLTAAITAVIAAILGLFGIKPGPYLVGVAVGVKITIVLLGVVFGARWLQKRGLTKAPPPGKTESQPPDQPAG
jgi:amino acid transporter